MEFRIVSHACLDVKASGKRLVIDPWLNEPTYWSSWWHCPPPIFGDDIFGADYVYITHWHFDHFDPKTLKKFGKSTTAVVPKFPISGLRQQLERDRVRAHRRAQSRRAFEARRRLLSDQLSDQLSGRQRRGRRSGRNGPDGSQRREAVAVDVAHLPREVSQVRFHAAQPLAGVVVSDALYLRRSGRPASRRRAHLYGSLRRRRAAAASALRDSVRQRHLPSASRGDRREPVLGLGSRDARLLHGEQVARSRGGADDHAGRQPLVVGVGVRADRQRRRRHGRMVRAARARSERAASEKLSTPRRRRRSPSTIFPSISRSSSARRACCVRSSATRAGSFRSTSRKRSIGASTSAAERSSAAIGCRSATTASSR